MLLAGVAAVGIGLAGGGAVGAEGEVAVRLPATRPPPLLKLMTLLLPRHALSLPKCGPYVSVAGCWSRQGRPSERRPPGRTQSVLGQHFR